MKTFKDLQDIQEATKIPKSLITGTKFINPDGDMIIVKKIEVVKNVGKFDTLITFSIKTPDGNTDVQELFSSNFFKEILKGK